MIDVVGLITARGKSAGFPGKHLAELCGEPVIVWTVRAALSSRYLRRVIVSTDDEAIANVCRAAGAEVPFRRPPDLATDTATHVSVIEHALRWLEASGDTPGYLMLLQPTSPLRTADDIDAAIEIARSSSADAVVAVCEAKHHPYKTFTVSKDGGLVPFFPSGLGYLRRQDLPIALAENGAIYLSNVSAFRAAGTVTPGHARPYVMPIERSVDIDTEDDLQLANLFLSRREG